MPHRLLESKIAFFSGSFSAFVYSIPVLEIDLTSLIVEGPIKLLFAIMIAFMGGIAGLAGKDFYNQHLKKYFDKNDTVK